MVKEVSVTIKGEESTFKQKFLIYDEFAMNEKDPVIKACVDQALANSKVVPDDIKVRALLVLR